MAKVSFENSMKKLETVVSKLEGDEVSLEESLKLFEEGVKLMRFCHLRLNEIEEKVQILVADESESGGYLEEFNG
ncbi:MAG: exodeoxyribonuclease VII small subunit [Deltaproteobacteria bacterium]|nr:MAG: exodeoxyribonuclease VII small subunit [Deltaproteobacteria bacterium]